MDCAENHYQPELAQTSSTACQFCGANSLSLKGNSLQTGCQCAPGHTGPNGEACVACYMGEYKPAKGPQACTLCPNETYSSGVAETSISACALCPEFSLSLEVSASRTDCRCRRGFLTADAGLPTSRCEACNGLCSTCGAGQYSAGVNASGTEACLPCASGFVEVVQGQCDACPLNATALPGSTTVTDCQCNPGYTGATAARVCSVRRRRSSSCLGR